MPVSLGSFSFCHYTLTYAMVCIISPVKSHSTFLCFTLTFGSHQQCCFYLFFKLVVCLKIKGKRIFRLPILNRFWCLVSQSSFCCQLWPFFGLSKFPAIFNQMLNAVSLATTRAVILYLIQIFSTIPVKQCSGSFWKQGFFI